MTGLVQVKKLVKLVKKLEAASSRIIRAVREDLNEYVVTLANLWLCCGH